MDSVRPRSLHAVPMQVSSIYTLGYAHWALDEVEPVIRVLDGILVDVRHTPYTSKPGFSKDELRDRFPNRYLHLDAFGNANYDGGPTELANPERGLEAISELELAPILMCGCKSPSQCHRSTVASLIADRWTVPVHHLRAPSERAQRSLFGEDR